MIEFPKNRYIGRSIQKRKPMKDILNVPIHEKYVFFIDKYLLNSKNAFEKFKQRKKSPARLNLSACESFNHSIYSEKISFKLPKFSQGLQKHKKASIDSLQDNIISVMPCVRELRTPDLKENYRAKSVQLKKKHKIDCKIQTEVNPIFEYESQDEESPMKYRPIYL